METSSNQSEAEYSPATETSSPHEPFDIHNGEFTGSPLLATLSDNDSVTSHAIPKSSSSSGSESGLSDSLQGSESFIDVTNTPPGPSSYEAQSIPAIPPNKALFNSATTSQNMGVKPSTSEAIVKLCSFVNSRLPPFDSD